MVWAAEVLGNWNLALRVEGVQVVHSLEVTQMMLPAGRPWMGMDVDGGAGAARVDERWVVRVARRAVDVMDFLVVASECFD